MGEVSQWDFRGTEALEEVELEGFLKVVLELMELRKRDKSTAGRSKVGSCIMLIKEVIKCKSDGKLVAV